MSATDLQALLRFLTKDAKIPLGTAMAKIKDLQAAMEKVDEVRQTNREPALKDPLTMVADGVGALGWVTVEGSQKPHEYIKELFGGAQIFGNKVLREYRDKCVQLHPMLRKLTRLDPTKPMPSGCKHTTSSSLRLQNMQRSTTPPESLGIVTA